MASKLNEPSKAVYAKSGASTQAHPSEFELTFKSFVIRKDAHVAPINHFASGRRKKEEAGKEEDVMQVVEVSKDQSTPMEVDGEDEDISHLSAQGWT